MSSAVRAMRVAAIMLLLASQVEATLSAEADRMKPISIVMTSPTTCSVNKKEMPCSALATYLKETLRARPDIRIYVSGMPMDNGAIRIREIVQDLKANGFVNSGLAGFVQD